MNEWITVDPNEINKQVTKQLHGVSVKVSFSPYDVPRSVRGFREKESPLFIIEFQYLIGEEEVRTEKPSPEIPVELEVGVHSQRIYRIKLDVEKLGCKVVRLQAEPLARDIVTAIKNFSSTMPEKLKERYKMTESVVFNHRDELLSPLAH